MPRTLQPYRQTATRHGNDHSMATKSKVVFPEGNSSPNEEDDLHSMVIAANRGPLFVPRSRRNRLLSLLERILETMGRLSVLVGHPDAIVFVPLLHLKKRPFARLPRTTWTRRTFPYLPNLLRANACRNPSARPTATDPQDLIIRVTTRHVLKFSRGWNLTL